MAAVDRSESERDEQHEAAEQEAVAAKEADEVVAHSPQPPSHDVSDPLVLLLQRLRV